MAANLLRCPDCRMRFIAPPEAVQGVRCAACTLAATRKPPPAPPPDLARPAVPAHQRQRAGAPEPSGNGRAAEPAAPATRSAAGRDSPEPAQSQSAATQSATSALPEAVPQAVSPEAEEAGSGSADVAQPEPAAMVATPHSPERLDAVLLDEPAAPDPAAPAPPAAVHAMPAPAKPAFAKPTASGLGKPANASASDAPPVTAPLRPPPTKRARRSSSWLLLYWLVTGVLCLAAALALRLGGPLVPAHWWPQERIEIAVLAAGVARLLMSLCTSLLVRIGVGISLVWGVLGMVGTVLLFIRIGSDPYLLIPLIDSIIISALTASALSERRVAGLATDSGRRRN